MIGRRHWRFSVQSLILLTALVAFVLGTIVSDVRRTRKALGNLTESGWVVSETSGAHLLSEVLPSRRAYALTIPFEKYSVSNLRDLKALPLVTKLSVDDKLDAANASGLLRHVPKVREVTLSFCDSSVICALTGLKSLESLVVRDASFDGENLSDLKDLLHLTHLDLGMTSIDDSGVAEIAELPNIESLDVDDTAITDNDLKVINSMRHLRNLRIACDEISPEGLEVLRNDSLRSVAVRMIWIDSSGTPEIAKNLPSCSIDAKIRIQRSQLDLSGVGL